MELRRYLSIVRRRLLLILAIIAAALVAGWYATPQTIKTYTATSRLYVGSRSISIDPQSGQVRSSGDQVTGLDRLIHTFTVMMQNPQIASQAIDSTNLHRLPAVVAASTDAKQVPRTNMFDVSVTDRDAGAARTLANAMSAAFIQQIQAFEPRNSENTEQVVSMYQRAVTPSVPNPSSGTRNVALAGLLGVLIAASVVVLLEHLDISLRSSEDVERHLELLVLGVVPSLGDTMPVTPASRVRTMQPSQPRGRRGSRVG
jgi:capsular polysaccharide biosynthesis protein